MSSFVRAYEVATTPQDNDVAHEFAADLGRLPAKLDNRRIGKLGLVADLEGWSYAADVVDPDEEARVDHSTLVALVRSPLYDGSVLRAAAPDAHLMYVGSSLPMTKLMISSVRRNQKPTMPG